MGDNCGVYCRRAAQWLDYMLASIRQKKIVVQRAPRRLRLIKEAQELTRIIS